METAGNDSGMPSCYGGMANGNFKMAGNNGKMAGGAVEMLGNNK